MNKKGSAMAWAVISMTVVLVIVLGVLSLARAYNQRSIDENAGRQAYLIARGMVDAVVSQIDGFRQEFAADATTFDYTNPLIPAEGVTLPLTDFALSGEDMSCSGFIQRPTAATLLVSVTAQQGGQARTVKALLQLTETTTGADLKKSFVGLYAGGTLTLAKGRDITTSADTDVYINNFSKNQGAQSNIDVGGTLYVGDAVKNLNALENSHTLNGAYVTWGELAKLRELPLAGDVRLDGSYIALNDDGNNPGLSAGKNHLIANGEIDYLTYTGTCDRDGRLSNTYNIGFGKTYYIKITPGCDVELTFVIFDLPLGRAQPNVYIFVDGDDPETGASSTCKINFLSFSRWYYHLYILGGEGSTIILGETPSSDTIYGSIMGDNVIIENDVRFDYVAPENLPGISESTVEGESTKKLLHTWDFSYYEKGEYNEVEE